MHTIRAFLLCCLSAIASAAEVSPISVRVEQVASNDSDKFKHSQKVYLKVFLTNAGSSDAKGLSVKYAFFGRDQETQEFAVVERGERNADVDGLRTAVVETAAAESKYAEEHGERISKRGDKNPFNNRKKGQNARYKTVEATGTKIVAYGVQVFSGGKLVAEAYSAPSVKEKMK
jgi:hypothetical protein